MSKNVIITCGTSLLNSKSITDDDLKLKLDEIDKIEEKDIAKFINYFIENNFENIKTKKLKIFGAELNILKKIYEKGDKIYLFFSETNGGKIVKSIFEEFFKSNSFKEKIISDEDFIFEKQIDFTIIEGFNVDNPEDFQQKAIKNFFEKLEDIKTNGNETIMCPVGGYKALIPYSSLYAMVQGWDIKYIYEDSDELMDLPGGALSYFIYETGIGENIDLKDSLSKNTKYNLKEVLELMVFVNNFKKYGYINNVENISEKIIGKNPAFERSLKLLKNTIDFVGINNKDLKNIKGDLKGLIKNLGKNDEIEAKFLKDVIDEIKDNFIDGNKIEGRFEIIKWYIGKERILEAFLILRELFIDIFSYYIFGEIKEKNSNQGEIDYRGLLETQSYILFYPDKKDCSKKYLEDIEELIKEQKNKIEELKNKIRNFENINELKKAYNKSKDIRNKLAHIGKQDKNFYNELNNINKYIEILKDFYKTIF